MGRVAFDDFRVNKNGEYEYKASDSERITNATIMKFRNLLRQHDLVAVEGVFASQDKIAKFRGVAKARGFTPVVVTISADPAEAFARGTHGVSESATKGMAKSIDKPLPANWEALTLDEAPAPDSETADEVEKQIIHPDDPLSPPATAGLPGAGDVNWSLAGEALASVTGLFPEEPITPDQGAKAEEIAGDATRLIEKFCHFGVFDSFKLQPPVTSFEDTYGALMDLTETEIAFITADLTSPDLIAAWTDSINRGRAYLRQMWPVMIRETPTGPRWVDPPTGIANQISVAMAVTSDPLRLLEEMNRGTATPGMFMCVRESKPEIAGRFANTFSDRLHAIGSSKNCPWDHELQLRMFFDLPPTGIVTFGVQGNQASKSTATFKIDFDGLKTKGQSLR